MRHRLGVIIFLLTVFTAELEAQQIIRGQVTDSKANPIPSASISLKDSNDKIVTFTRSDLRGNFTLPLRKDALTGQLEVSYLGYKRQKITVLKGQQEYHVTLIESAIDLPTVVINKNPRLRLNGDTLSYQLSDFSEKKDRVLEDVLKKMPGIEVAANGKITYNGKAISNFYIDGDNLLDDKYNIATRSIRKEAVDKVQVIENDQPVKMLRNKTVSDEVALNITIKDEAKLNLMGQASLGAGLPGKFDGNTNAMLFNKKYKGINYIKGNNTGKDPAEDLISHNLDSYLKRLENDKPETLLSGASAGDPDLPQRRYLFNQAGLVNINNLFNFKKEVQLKTNIYYLRDKQQRDYSRYTDYYLPSGNISYSEMQHNTAHIDQLHVQANLTINRDKFYLSNVFLSDYNPLNQQIALSANTLATSQQLHQKKFDISNEFNLMNTLKSGKVINFYSYLNAIHQPESLFITPGLNPDQFNKGANYSSLDQNLSTSSFFTNNYVSLRHYTGAITHTYKTGFSLQKQQLVSSLMATQTDLSTDTAIANGINHLNWNRAEVFAEGKYEYPGEKLKATLSLPVIYQHTQYEDPAFDLQKKLNKIIFNPKVLLKLQTSIENYLTLNLSRITRFGAMTDIYEGAILRNYRSLYANDAPLSQEENSTAALGFNYKKAIILFFFSLQASYSKIVMNTITSSVINNNLQQRIVLPFDNHTDSWSVNGNISKYLFKLKSTLSAGINYSQRTANQIQNEQLLPYQAKNIGFKMGDKSKLSSWMSLDYSANYNQYRNKNTTATLSGTGFNQFNQQCGLDLTIFRNIFINASGEYLSTKQMGQEKLNYLFADLSVKYRAEKLRADFEFSMNNFTDVKTYKDVYLSTNILTRGIYQIPGRIIMLKATFNF